MTAKEWKDLYINWKRLCAANPSITNVIHASLTYNDLTGTVVKVSYTIDTKDMYINNMHEFYITFAIDLPDMLEHRAICTVVRADGLGYGDKFISNDSELAVKYLVLEELGKKMQEIINKYQSKEDKPMEEPTKMTFVTLCGSHRFYDEFIRIKNDMEKDGNTHVFTPEIFQFADPSKLDEQTHQRLDELHQAKMKQSDYVLIVNKDGYIGEDTKKEIQWCKSNGIVVKYIETPIEQLQTIFVTLNYFYTDDRVEVPIPVDEYTCISRTEFLRRLEATLKAFGDRWVKAYIIKSGQKTDIDAKVKEFNLQVKVSGGDCNEDT